MGHAGPDKPNTIAMVCTVTIWRYAEAVAARLSQHDKPLQCPHDSDAIVRCICQQCRDWGSIAYCWGQ